MAPRGRGGIQTHGTRISSRINQPQKLDNTLHTGIGRGVSGTTPCGGKGSSSNIQPRTVDKTLMAGTGRGLSSKTPCGGRGSSSNIQPRTSDKTLSAGIGRGVCDTSPCGGWGSSINRQSQNLDNTSSAGIGRGVSGTTPYGHKGSSSRILDNIVSADIGRGISGTSAHGGISGTSPQGDRDFLSDNGLQNGSRKHPSVNTLITHSEGNMVEDPGVHEESQPPTSNLQQRKKRGITMGVKPPKPGQEKILVNVLTRTLSPIQARTKIGPLFRKCFKKCRTKFSDWNSRLNFVWGEYLRYFRFLSPEEEARGRLVWEHIARQNYPKYLHRWKLNAEKLYGSIAEARKHKQDWTSLAVWQQLCDYWMSDKFLKASDLRKRNRSSNKGIPHTSGNVTYEERNLTLFNILGREPTQWETFNETHQSNLEGSEKKFVSEDAQKFSETYANRLRKANDLELTAPVNGIQDHGLKIYEEVVGGVRKGRLVGRPGEKWSKRSGSVSSQDFAAQVASQQTSQELKKLKEDLTGKTKIITDQTAYIHCMFQYMESWAEQCGMPPPPRPPNFSANSSSEGASNTPYSSPLNPDVDDEMDDDEMDDDEMDEEMDGDEEVENDY